MCPGIRKKQILCLTLLPLVSSMPLVNLFSLGLRYLLAEGKMIMPVNLDFNGPFMPNCKWGFHQISWYIYAQNDGDHHLVFNFPILWHVSKASLKRVLIDDLFLKDVPYFLKYLKHLCQSFLTQFPTQNFCYGEFQLCIRQSALILGVSFVTLLAQRSLLKDFTEILKQEKSTTWSFCGFTTHSWGNGKYCACSTSAMYWLNIYIFNIWRNTFLSLRIWSHSPQMQVGS